MLRTSGKWLSKFISLSLKRKNKKLIFVKEPALNLLFLYQAHRMLYALNQQRKKFIGSAIQRSFLCLECNVYAIVW